MPSSGNGNVSLHIGMVVVLTIVSEIHINVFYDNMYGHCINSHGRCKSHKFSNKARGIPSINFQYPEEKKRHVVAF